MSANPESIGRGLRIAHVGTFDVANYGDLLFPLVLRRRLGGLVSEVVSLSPNGGQAVLSDSVATRSVESLADTRLELDGIVVGGGNILHASPWNRALYDTGGLSGITAYPRLWLGAADAAARREIPIVWNAVGVPRPFAEDAARIVGWAWSVCDYASVRDRSSARYLERAGVTDPVAIVPDTALDVRDLWTSDELNAAFEAIFATRGLAVPERVVAVHLNERYAPRTATRTAAAVERLCKRADAVPLLLALGPCHGDGGFAREIGEQLRTAVIVDRPSSLLELTAAIAGSEAYVGSSLHGLICACAFGVPSAVVASERQARLRKFSGFLEQVHLERWLIDSWPTVERSIDELLSEPVETWSCVHALARPALDRHWAAITSALTGHGDPERRSVKGRGAIQRLAELSASPDGDSALYGTIVPEILRTLVAEQTQASGKKAKRRDLAAAERTVAAAVEVELHTRAVGAAARARRLSAELRAAEGEAEELRSLLAKTHTALVAAQAERDEAHSERDGLRDRLAMEAAALEAARRDRGTARARAAALADDLRSAREASARTFADVERVERLLTTTRHTVGLLEEDLGAGHGRLAARRVARLRAEVGEAARTIEAAAAPAPDRSRSPSRTRRGRRRKVTVVAWDMGHNPLGRAALIADVLRGSFDVEVVGAQFERYGAEIWRPFQASAISCRTFPGRTFPDHLDEMERMAREIDGDVIYVSKPRLPSLALGALAKECRNRPLLLDVDDRELAFFGESEGLSLDELESHGDDPDLLLPFSRLWTRACETLVGSADHVTVSNPTLARLYGGTLFPHVRDETVFDPSRYDRDAARRRFGLPVGARIVLFAGTPRRHKGVVELARALDRIGDKTIRLCLFATQELRELERDLAPYARFIETLPPVPFAELPGALALADLACVLQDPGSDIARYQIPAKVTDALAMGIPCLATPVPPLQPLVEAGAVAPLDGVALEDRLRLLLQDDASAAELAARGRDVFLSELSYAAVRPRIEGVIEGLVESPPPLSLGLAELLRVQRSTFGAPTRPAVMRAPRPARPQRLPARRSEDDRYDVVVFWKQNDTGIYGRRQEMLVRALAASERVHRIAHFDEPLELETLRLLGRPNGRAIDQAHLVARQTWRRVLRIGNRDGKVAYRTFLHRSQDNGVGIVERLLPAREEYPAWVASCLAADGIGRRTTVFWVYPRNFDFVSLATAIGPDLVLADVVDDHRTWLDPSSSYHARVTRNYEEILGAADVVLANCEPVQRAMSALHQPVHLVPNAAEGPGSSPPGARRPRELRKLEGPVIGYVGNLSSRIDIDLLDAVARRRPDWNLVFIGSAHLGQDILRLDEYPNVHFLGVRPYEEAKRFIRAFDVGLIPHLDNEMTRSMNPLKAFVYLAENVPVISTEIANLGQLEGLVSLASCPDEFIASIDAALRRGAPTTLPQRHAQMLSENSWSARVEHILGLLDEACLERRAA